MNGESENNFSDLSDSESEVLWFKDLGDFFLKFVPNYNTNRNIDKKISE